MTLAIAWLAFPALLGLVCLGCGILLEELSRRRVPVLLLMPLGLAFVVVVVQLATVSDLTAEAGLPLVLGAAVLGFGLSYPWGRVDPWAALAPLLAYAAYAAPVVLSGEATFAGYIKLDDTATWFALTDRVMEHGRSVEGLAPSTYEAALSFNLADGYPVGAFLPLGVGRALTGQDVAWVFQPYLAFCAAMLAAALYVLAGRALRPGPVRMLAALFGAQPALLFGYVLWGGVKEVLAAALIASLAALLAEALAAEDGPRDGHLALLAVTAAALVAVTSGLGAVWLLALLVPAAAVVARRRGTRAAARGGVIVAGAALALSAPLLIAGGLTPPTSAPVTSDAATGNLAEPLSLLQGFGVWPEGDFRFGPERPALTYVLIGLAAAAVAAGVLLALRRRALGLVVFVAGTCAATAAIVAVGSPWVDAKALAVASPALVFGALVGAGLLARHRARLPALVLGVAVCGGVAWSNVLAYHEANLAPRDRHAELEEIGGLIAGQGPTLMTEYEPYGVRHFLREADPEGASELRRRLVPLRGGRPLRKLGTADIDEFDLGAVRAYRTLVLRRSPVASRPPSVYRLIERGRFYDVWQLAPGREDSLLEHLPLGGGGDPAARPACERVRALARRAAAAGARLAASELPPPVRVDLAAAAERTAVAPVPGSPGAVEPVADARFAATVEVPDPGEHLIFAGGAFRRRLEVSVDGRRVASRRHRLSHAGHHEPLGAVELARGAHRVELRYGGADLAPGSGGPALAVGPLHVSRPSDPRVLVVSPRNARRLCGRPLDWIESVTAAG